MSVTLSQRPQPKSTQRSAADRDAFVQVERWMALIREVSREPAKG
jgi:hypothetical protein